jgi:hypothetical protein
MKKEPKLTARELDVLIYLVASASCDGDPLKHYDDPAAGYNALSSARRKLERMTKP